MASRTGAGPRSPSARGAGAGRYSSACRPRRRGWRQLVRNRYRDRRTIRRDSRSPRVKGDTINRKATRQYDAFAPILQPFRQMRRPMQAPRLFTTVLGFALVALALAHGPAAPAGKGASKLPKSIPTEDE